MEKFSLLTLHVLNLTFAFFTRRYDKCDEHIKKFQRRELEAQPGFTVEETLEVRRDFFHFIAF